MCSCGCNTCDTKIRGPLLTENKVKPLLSEGLQYHIDKRIPLFETVYRISSNKHLSLIKEARKMYSRGIIDLCEEDEDLIKTNIGEFAVYEGEVVPLDLPIKNSNFLKEIIKSVLQEKTCWKGYKQYGMKTKDGKKVPNCVPIDEDKLNEAEFKGKDVKLNKPKRGGSKAYYVYVNSGKKTKDGKVKAKKVSFGSGGLRAKIKNKDARNAFAKRHNCKDKKDRTKAGYWSCNLPKYAKALGLGSNMNTYW